MRLTDEEQAMLAGEFGAPSSLASIAFSSSVSRINEPFILSGYG